MSPRCCAREPNRALRSPALPRRRASPITPPCCAPERAPTLQWTASRRPRVRTQYPALLCSGAVDDSPSIALKPRRGSRTISPCSARRTARSSDHAPRHPLVMGPAVSAALPQSVSVPLSVPRPQPRCEPGAAVNTPGRPRFSPASKASRRTAIRSGSCRRTGCRTPRARRGPPGRRPAQGVGKASFRRRTRCRARRRASSASWRGLSPVLRVEKSPLAAVRRSSEESGRRR